MPDALRIRAHAKLNLLLRVLAREADGYHGIETVFARLDLHDELEAERTEAPGVSLDVEGAACGPAQENLAVRAAQMVPPTERRARSTMAGDHGRPMARCAGAGSSPASTACM